jgi:hypothetical protein
VPVLSSTHPEEPRGSTFRAADLTIRVGRFDGEPIDWVAIEPVEPTAPRLVLTTESAGRLAQRVSEELTLDQK